MLSQIICQVFGVVANIGLSCSRLCFKMALEAIPSRNNDHKTMIKFLKENILSRFGIPHTLNESFICHD
jgi:hypothetical protein